MRHWLRTFRRWLRSWTVGQFCVFLVGTAFVYWILFNIGERLVEVHGWPPFYTESTLAFVRRWWALGTGAYYRADAKPILLALLFVIVVLPVAALVVAWEWSGRAPQPADGERAEGGLLEPMPQLSWEEPVGDAEAEAMDQLADLVGGDVAQTATAKSLDAVHRCLPPATHSLKAAAAHSGLVAAVQYLRFLEWRVNALESGRK